MNEIETLVTAKMQANGGSIFYRDLIADPDVAPYRQSLPALKSKMRSAGTLAVVLRENPATGALDTHFSLVSNGGE